MNEINLRRLGQLQDKYKINQTYSVTLEELEYALSSSRRNTSNITKSLANYGWITWSPSVGRGKTSQLTVLVDIQTALLEVIENELKLNRFSLITRLLEIYGTKTIQALSVAIESRDKLDSEQNQLLIKHYPRIDTLSPQRTYRHAELQIISCTYDTLVKKTAHGSVSANLAHDWCVTSDSVTLWLRSDIYIHNGRKLKVDDVISSLLRLKNSECPVAYLFKQIHSIEASYDNSIVIKLTEPSPFFLVALTSPSASITADEKIHFNDDKWLYLGTGPFKVTNWNSEHLELSKNELYFTDKPLLNKISFAQCGDILENYMSFSSSLEAKKGFTINALSYLSVRRRACSTLDEDSLNQLIDYLSYKKTKYCPEFAVSGLTLAPINLADTPTINVPKLRGEVILAEPTWNIEYLRNVSDWLHLEIRKTGLQLTVIEMENISAPEELAEKADLLFLEEVIENPISYGIYEWLMISSGIKFLYQGEALKHHQQTVKDASLSERPQVALAHLEKQLISKRSYLPLYVGVEYVSQSCQVRGVNVNKSGFSDFSKLWVSSEKINS